MSISANTDFSQDLNFWHYYVLETAIVHERDNSINIDYNCF